MVELIRSGCIRVIDIVRPLALAEDGQALVEYSLILLLIVLVCVGALQLMGQEVTSILDPLSHDL